MEIFTAYVMPILIGAVIGYFTNYLAIKMLFRPKKAWYLFSCHVPFTPGIVPKNQPRIAKAVGAAVGETLITDADIKNMLLSEKIRSAVSDEIVDGLTGSEHTFNDLVGRAVGEENLEEVKDTLADYMYTRIESGMRALDIEAIIANEGAAFIKQKITGVLALMLNESVIKSMAKPIAGGISEYVNTHGEELLKPTIASEIDVLSEERVNTLVARFGMDDSFLRAIVENVYVRAVRGKADELIGKFDIPKIVENKINQMGTDELEALVMSVMKKELNAVVSLGALLGAIISILNFVF